MSEFNNRIELQREVIKIVNRKGYASEITGISKKAIERWILENNLESGSELTNLLYEISSKLFFLGNRSQEQITDSYMLLNSELTTLVDSLKSQPRFIS